MIYVLSQCNVGTILNQLLSSSKGGNSTLTKKAILAVLHKQSLITKHVNHGSRRYHIESHWMKANESYWKQHNRQSSTETKCETCTQRQRGEYMNAESINRSIDESFSHGISHDCASAKFSHSHMKNARKLNRDGTIVTWPDFHDKKRSIDSERMI